FVEANQQKCRRICAIGMIFLLSSPRPGTAINRASLYSGPCRFQRWRRGGSIPNACVPIAAGKSIVLYPPAVRKLAPPIAGAEHLITVSHLFNVLPRSVRDSSVALLDGQLIGG